MMKHDLKDEQQKEVSLWAESGVEGRGERQRGGEVAMKGTTMKALMAMGWVLMAGMWAVFAQGQERLADCGTSAGGVEGSAITFRKLAKDVDMTQVTKWLEENAASILAANGGDYEAAAMASAANGRRVWECYVAGLDPTDAGAEFKVTSIEFQGGKLMVKWNPDLNEDETKMERVYRVHGKRSMSDGEWSDVTNVDHFCAGGHFFRLCISMADGLGKTTYSSNAVGFIEFTIPAGEKLVLAVPFVNMNSDDGLFRFGETQIAEWLPVGSSVFFWDMDNQKWGGGMKSEFGWKSAEFNHVLMPGEGFCVMNPSEHEVKVSAAGEVPSDERIRVVYRGDSSWSSMANPYPVETTFGDTSLARELPTGSVVYFWNMEQQKWSGGSKSEGGWDPAEANYTLMPGEAFAIRSGSEEEDGMWEVRKPYEWP